MKVLLQAHFNKVITEMWDGCAFKVSLKIFVVLLAFCKFYCREIWPFIDFMKNSCDEKYTLCLKNVLNVSK